MPNWRKVLGGVDRLVLRAVEYGQRVLIWPAVYAVAWAAAAWPLLHPDRLRDWSDNDLTDPERITQLNYLLGACGVMAALLAGFFLLGRVRRGGWRITTRARSFNRFFAFSLGAPFIVALTVPAIENRRPFHTMFFIGVVTLCVLPTAAVVWESVHRRSEGFLRKKLPVLSRLAPAATILGLFAGYSYWFSRLSINAHHALQTRIFDLAIYDNIFYQSSHGNFLGCSLASTGTHITAHFDPILAILSPLYLLYPRAELILVLQAVWCAVGVVPAYLLGRDHLDSKWAGVVFALAWAVYPALHGANAYEFHSLTLLGMPVLWLMYFLMARRVRSFFLLLPLVLLVREDASLLVCGIAFTAILVRDPRLTRLGWVTLGIAAVYFVVTKTVIMAGVDQSPVAAVQQIDPLGGKHGFAWYYKDLIPKGGGLRDLLIAFVTNPAFVLDLALREAKIVFLLQLFLPLAFLPLAAKPWRFAMAFGLFYILLATRKPVYSIHFQYSVVLFPVLFALAPIGLQQLRNGGLPRQVGLQRSQLVSVVLAAVLVSSLLMSWKFGGLLSNDAFKGGFRTPPRTLSAKQIQRYQELRGFLEQIPPDAAVTAVGRMGPHLSNRARAYKYRHHRPSDFLVFDARDLKGSARTNFKKRFSKGEFQVLDKQGTFELYRQVEVKTDKPETDEPKTQGTPKGALPARPETE
jgi:uncharacterized membrane protein